jgi:hypothetical protein
LSKLPLNPFVTPIDSPGRREWAEHDADATIFARQRFLRLEPRTGGALARGARGRGRSRSDRRGNRKHGQDRKARQPTGRGNSQRLSIANARDEIADLLADNPSLKTLIDEVTASAYRYARRKAAIEMGLGEEAFPAQCPWSFGQATDASFWPE